MQLCFILHTNLNYCIKLIINITNNNQFIVLFKENIIVEDNNIN